MSDALDAITGFFGDVGSSVVSGVSDVGSAIGSGVSDLVSGAGDLIGAGSTSGAPVSDIVAGTGEGGGAGDLLASAGTPAAPTGVSAATLGGGFPVDTSGATDPFASGAGGLGAGTSAGSPLGITTAPSTSVLTAGYAPTTAAPTGGGGGYSGTGGGSGGGAIGGKTPLASSGSGLWNDLTSGNVSNLPGDVGKLIASNPGAVLAGGGLLYNLLRNNNIPGQSQLTGEAAQLAAQGKKLSSYLQKGTLPPGVQTSIQTATAAAEAAIRSKYASMGLSGGTAEQQEINGIRAAAVSQGTQIAENLLNTGITESNLAAGIYENLIKINQDQSAATGQAIANFAAALNGTTPGITLKVA